MKSAKSQFKSLKPYLKAYGEAINEAVTKSILRRGKFKDGYFHYNAAPGYLDLHTGEFVQDGKPMPRKFKYP